MVMVNVDLYSAIITKVSNALIFNSGKCNVMSKCNVNVEFKVTLHEQVRAGAPYSKLQLQSVTQPNIQNDHLLL